MTAMRGRPHQSPVLIVAGGTGGHVYPALAVARELLGRGIPVVWVGTRRGLEASVVPAAGIQIEWISVTGLRGKSFIRKLRAPFMLSLALWQALRVILRQRPRMVLGMGGFITGPTGVAAWMLRAPLCIHEQNAVAGLTNRVLARLARRVFAAFPDAFASKRNALVTGNPVRSEICALPTPQQRFDQRNGAMRLLVLGGSLGAQALNEIVPKALALLPEQQRPLVRHQAGVRNIDAARAAYASAAVQAEVSAFIENMAQAYAWADLVLCRAGALTVAELTAAGVGAVLVPYPYAVDDHQTHNAGYLVDGGAGILISQSQLTPERLAELVKGLAEDRARLLEMAVSARALARPDAARTVVDLCLQTVHG